MKHVKDLTEAEILTSHVDVDFRDLDLRACSRLSCAHLYCDDCPIDGETDEFTYKYEEYLQKMRYREI